MKYVRHLRQRYDRGPIIVIGMHRSGTSLLSNLLQAMGVHMGADTTRTEESRFFRGLNERLLRRASAKWHLPGPVRRVLKSPARVQALAKELESANDSAGIYRYCGSASLERTAWGWKDPRTTVTLPVWLDLFPDAQVIHIVRNGIDVADSLLRRSQRKRRLRWTSRLRIAAQNVIPRRPAEQNTPIARYRFRGLDEGFELWQCYLRFAESGMRCLSPENRHALRFEDLARQPLQELDRLAAFIQRPQSISRLGELARQVDHERAWSFERSAELAGFAAKNAHAPMMKRYGYAFESRQESASNRGACRAG